MSHITILPDRIPTESEEVDADAPTVSPTVSDPAKASRPSSAAGRPDASKSEIVLKKLQLSRGVTVAQIVEVTGWQSHSVRGFFSAVVRKKLGLNLVSEVGKDGQRRYRIVDYAAKAAD
ncbi:MAG: DUF3489 domain-containing protein [Mesorhizobium sp.]|nr:DUF3489 domain-containing protein [Mesorhizobium sp.]